MVNVLAFEIEELKKRVNQAIDLRKEIEELGKTANEQGDETFGHDNPILEAKHEKERYLSSILPGIREAEEQLKNCLIIGDNFYVSFFIHI